MLALETKQLNKIWLVFCLFVVVFFRRSHQSCSVKKGALKNFAKFTGKHLCQSIFLRLQASGLFFIKKEILAHVFSCKLCEMFKNTSGRVLLFFCSCFEEYSPKSNCVNNNKTKQQLEKNNVKTKKQIQNKKEQNELGISKKLFEIFPTIFLKMSFQNASKKFVTSC